MIMDNVYRPVCVEKGKKNIKENHQYYLKEVPTWRQLAVKRGLKRDSMKGRESTTLNPMLSLSRLVSKLID